MSADPTKDSSSGVDASAELEVAAATETTMVKMSTVTGSPPNAAARRRFLEASPPPLLPHAYHLNLPPHCFDPVDGLPYVTKHARREARRALALCRSMELTEDIFLEGDDGGSGDDGDDDDNDDNENGGEDGGGGGENGTKEDGIRSGNEDMAVDGTEDDDGNRRKGRKETMVTLVKKCHRLSTQLSALDSLKHGGLTQAERCEIVLRVMKLICATVVVSECDDGDAGRNGESNESTSFSHRKVRLSFDDVGCLVGPDGPIDLGLGEGFGDFLESACVSDSGLDGTSLDDRAAELERSLSEPFALPSPARESLLSVAIDLLGKKGPLRSCSNNAVSVPGDDKSRQILVLNWRALLRTLLRTAPYLDEHKCGVPPVDSSSRQSTVLRRTVHLIRSGRGFFEQGLRPSRGGGLGVAKAAMDKTAREIWKLTKEDLLHRTHSNSCFRSIIILYLFQPSRCCSSFYEEVLPEWLGCWSSVDRCPEYDYLWLVLFCRARKYVRFDGFEWSAVRRRLLTQCGYWLQIPVGGSSSDKSYPRAAPPKSRGFPYRLKSFVGSAGGYQEGIDFVRKVSKLLVFCLGRSDHRTFEAARINGDVQVKGNNGASVEGGASITLSSGTTDLVRFLDFTSPYFHPSNTGAWTYPLGVLLHYLSYDLCRRTALSAATVSLQSSHPSLAAELERLEPHRSAAVLPAAEAVAVLDSMLPLCQQSLYSKNSHVASAGESALTYLTHIDPVRVSPPFLDLAARALDVSSVTMSHQAPAALSALMRLVQPGLRRRPYVLLGRLPELLRLSLAGVDGNDQNKTIRTLIFYRNLCSWLPVGSSEWHDRDKSLKETDGTIRVGNSIMDSLCSLCSSPEYTKALSALPESSLLSQKEHGQSTFPSSDSNENLVSLLEETAHATSDWALSFLDRIFLLLRTAGESEKAGKISRGGGGGHAGGSYVASRHSSADARQARNFSRVLRETLCQVFAAMDDSTHVTAVRSVVRFVKEETLPNAAKDAGALCTAVASARSAVDKDEQSCNPGLDSLAPVLVSDIAQTSTRVAIYRLRCLSGAVRYAGRSVLDHRHLITAALDHALVSDAGNQDRHLFKTGCKLLRHTLASQCEAYPYASDRRPRIQSGKDDGCWTLGKSAQLRGDGVEWQSPSGNQIDFVAELLHRYVMQRLSNLGCVTENNNDKAVNVMRLRKTLRVVRYALRGCSGILLDAEDFETVASRFVPARQIFCSLSKRRFHKTESMISALSLDGVEADAENDGNFIGPHESATLSLVLSASDESQAFLSGLRGRFSALLVSVLCLIASGTSHSENGQAAGDASCNNDESSLPAKVSADDNAQAMHSDAKICKESIEISQLLLTRRSANFRAADEKTLWRAQKELLTDYALSDTAEYLATSLQCAGLYGDFDGGTVLYKDGEDGGKTVPRRLLVNGVDVFHRTLQRDASYGIPRRLRRQRWIRGGDFQRLFTLDVTVDDVLIRLRACGNKPSPPTNSSLDAYEALLHGLFALSCHTNVDVRGRAIGAVDYAFRRFGWTVQHCIPRLLEAISLRDEHKRGLYGIPSCNELSFQLDVRGERKRLAEVLKGVCSMLSLARTTREVLATEGNRLALIRTLSDTQGIISLLPPEEMQKMVHYIQAIFSQFRSKFYRIPRILGRDQKLHEECLAFLLSALATSEDSPSQGQVESEAGESTKFPQSEERDAPEDSKRIPPARHVTLKPNEKMSSERSYNWRNRLTLGWLLTTLMDETDLVLDDPHISSRVWTTAFNLVIKEVGQPLQRVALGLLGRLVTLSLLGTDFLHLSRRCGDCGKPSIRNQATSKEKAGATLLRERMSDGTFCRDLGNALVYDHKEDTSVGGGHHAQWSAGVEEILRDASANVAPRTLFPFQRTSRSSPTFKVSHAQLVQAILLMIGKESAVVTGGYFLEHCKELAGSPPSEDQRNQLCTSAEMFAGVCRALLQMSHPDEIPRLWNSLLLPFLDDAITKVPISHQGAFFDAFRYGIHHFPPSYFLDLTKWAIVNIEKTLWQSEFSRSAFRQAQLIEDSNENTPQAQLVSEGTLESVTKITTSADGFTTQSKWLFLVSSILIELDGETDLGAVQQLPWYTVSLLQAAQIGPRDEAAADLLPVEDLVASWVLVCERLLPRLLSALGHPYEKCREHIAGCLFRICYCHRKFSRTPKPLKNGAVAQGLSGSPVDPGDCVVKSLVQIDDPLNETYSFKEKHHALITARKFIVYCVHLGDCKNEFSEYVIPLLPLCFRALKVKLEADSAEDANGDASNRMLEAEVVKGYRYQISEVSCSCVVAYGRDEDLSRVLRALGAVSKYDSWQIRQAAANFVRCFQGGHKYLFEKEHSALTMRIVTSLLVDERREVSSAAMAALTGILAFMRLQSVSDLVAKYVRIANKSVVKRKKGLISPAANVAETDANSIEREKERARKQQKSIHFLCAAVLSRPYDTPPFVPIALTALSKHSYERSAPLGVREVVKMCCAEFKRTHMTDNWELHRKQFSQEQLEALEDVVSTPHYYA